MTTLPYADLLAQVEALAGASLATPEQARVKIFANRRARKAHRECDYWPHLLYVGEERIVSDKGFLTVAQTELQTIDKIIRIHAEDPFKSQAVYEYTEYYEANGGIQIAGYQAAEHTVVTGYAVTGCDNPEYDGEYNFNAALSTTLSPVYVDTNNANNLLYDIGVQVWVLGYVASGQYWTSGFATYATPDLVPAWSTVGGATGIPAVTVSITYSAFITYLAGIPATYGDGSGEESDVPEPWFEYMAQGAYCDWLRSDGQTEKAMTEEVIAESLLNQQLEKISRSNGNQVVTRMMSHGTKQAR